MPLAPASLAEIIAPACREIAGPGAVSLQTLPGGASLRRYHRATIADGRPGTLVIMELGDDRAAEEVTSGGPPPRDPFIDVLEYLARGGIGVPALYRHDPARGLLYLEDLGDETFEARVQRQDESGRERYYRLAIDALVELQHYAAEQPQGCIAFGRAFDQKLLLWELDHFREWGLEVGASVQLEPSERALLDREFGSISQQLAAEPRGFVHRDFQSRNLMLQGDRIRIIDFQDALLGTRAYDLVALLRDSYVQLAPALLSRLIAYYAECTGCPLGPFRRLFDLQTVQRKLKDAGRFVYIDRVKKNPTFLQHIPTSHAAVAGALARLPELAPLTDLLRRRWPQYYTPSP